MSRRVRPPLPPVLPPDMTEAERISCLRQHTTWTHCQARVVLLGVELRTYEDIAARAGCSAGTVHLHYSAAFERVDGGDQKSVTALAVAILWQSKCRGCDVIG